MACGIPVVASRRASIPEIADRPEGLFDPLDPEDIAAKMEQSLRNPEARAEAKRWGPDKAARYSWEETARATLGVYQSMSRQDA